MKKLVVFGIASLSLASLFMANNSYADRDAMPFESAAIYGALKSEGCMVTDDIEVEPVHGLSRYDIPTVLAPGIYKTKAICMDGHKYDIKMDSQLHIVTKEKD